MKLVDVGGRADLVAQVRVAVDQSRQTGLVRQVDFGRSGWRIRAGSATLAYALALNDDSGRAQHFATDDVDQVPAMDHTHPRLSRASGCIHGHSCGPAKRGGRCNHSNE